jgi:hypothetical protein
MFVKGCVINTDAFHICIFLGDQYWVRYPSRCFDLFDEPSSSKWWSSAAIALRFGSSKHRRGCLTGRAFGIHIECMLGKFPGNSWHVHRTPSKDFPALTEELDECALLCRHEILGWICTFFTSCVQLKA